MDQLALEKLLHDQIPMSKAMGIKVVRSDDTIIELSSPLLANHNHVGTAFGGSLSTLMILAGYCRLFVLMNGTGHVLLKNTTMQFLKPVGEELRAIARMPDRKLCDHFLKTLEKKKRARITLNSEIILNDGTVAARMTGEFVGI